MSSKVIVIDYGIGNLLSVCRGLEHCGAEVVLSDDPAIIAQAERLVLPGVGAFEDGMKGLRERGLVEPIQELAKKNRPFLGICLGMQMMLEVSEEFGTHEGLGLIEGKVAPIPNTKVDGTPHKIPHISWSELILPEHQDWQGTMLDGIAPGSSMYFVHSFTAMPTHLENRFADADYNGRQISAVVRKGNVYGCQFHPEKSGPLGLHILKNFCQMS